MSTQFWIARAAGMAAGLAASAALAADLSSNLENVTSGAENATPAQWLCASFSTDASSHSLTSATLMLGNSAPGAAQLLVYSNGNLEPGSLLGSLSSPGVISSTPSAATFTSPGIALAAGTTYWLVLAPTAGAYEWAWTADNTGAGAGFQHVWGVSPDSGASWWSSDIYAVKLRVGVDEAAACYANCDGSTAAPVLNVQDFSCFLQRYASGDTWANCDGSTGAPVLNVGDFSCFLQKYATGCP